MEQHQGGGEMYGGQATAERRPERGERTERGEREVPVRARPEPTTLSGQVRAFNAPVRLPEVPLESFTTKLVTETFEAIVGATAKQAETYAQILKEASKSVDELAEQVTDAQVFAFLAEHYPDHLGGTVVRGDYEFEDEKEEEKDEGEGKKGSEKLRKVVESLKKELSDPQSGRELDIPEPPENARGFDYLDVEKEKPGKLPEKISRAVAEKIADKMREKLSLLARTGVPRIVVTGGEIASKVTFKVSATEAERREASRLESDALGTNVRGSRDGWKKAAMSAAHSRLSVSPVNEENFDPATMDGSIVGELRLEFATERFPALAGPAGNA